MIIITTIITSILAVYFLYSICATIMIRTFSKKIVRTINKKYGVLLTFDDGPHPEYTRMLLNLLKKYQIKSVFFVVGELVEHHPDIIQQMYDEGHMIGIHHNRHTSNWLLTPFQTMSEIRQTYQKIKKVIDQEVIVYRPPWGHFNLFTLQMSNGLHTVMWSQIYKDWKVKNHRLDALLNEPPSDGAIILLHDNGDTKGADHTAPLEMLRYLEKYLQQCKQKQQTFANPYDVFGQKEGKAI